MLAAPEVQSEAPEAVAFDAEIAAIFSEEAAELLEAADRALSSWKTDADSREQVEELKRHLHTLKGGARMAGITPMGNLSHELEALIINIDDGRITANSQIHDILQQTIDELHRMRDTVIAGRNVSAATELEQRIQSINIGKPSTMEAPQFIEAPAEELAEADKPETVEFTIEPEDTVSMVIVDTPLNDELDEITRAAKPAPVEEAPPELPELPELPVAEPPPPVTEEVQKKAEEEGAGKSRTGASTSAEESQCEEKSYEKSTCRRERESRSGAG